MNLSVIFKQRRAKLRLSQVDLAEMAGVSVCTVKDIERGKANPSLSVVNKLCEVLGIELDFRLRQTI